MGFVDIGLDWRSPSSRLVLTAVLDILASEGYEGLTVASVKHRSGLAGPALGEAPDLERLVIVSLEQIHLMTAPLPTGSLRGDLVALLHPWRAPCGRDERVIAAVLSAAQFRPPLKAAVADVVDRQVGQAVGTLLSRATVGEVIPAWMQTLSWVLRGLMLERLRTGARSQVDLEALVDFLLAGVTQAPGRRTADPR